jgi:WD40 repeat protein
VTADDTVAELAYSADGRTLISSGIDSVTLWNTAGYGTPDRIADFDTGSQPLATAYGRDGRSVITVRSDGTASFWDLSRPNRPVPSAAVTVHPKYLDAAAISADRRTIAAGSNDDQLTLTDVADPQHPARLATVDVPFTHSHPAEMFHDMAFSPDGHMLAFTSWYGNLFLYDVSDQSHPRLILKKPATSAGSLGTIAFSPDGRTLAAGDDRGRVLLWSLARPGAPVQVSVLVGRRASTGITSIPVSFSPDGRTLVASGSTNKAALLWDVTDPAHPARLAGLTLGATVRSAMFSPDGHLMATATDDHAVVLWDVTDGHSPVRLATAQSSTLGPVLALGPDGHTLVTASTATVTLWDFSGLNTIRADAARQACTMAGRGLTADEWARYIPEVPYVRTCQ